MPHISVWETREDGVGTGRAPMSGGVSIRKRGSGVILGVLGFKFTLALALHPDGVASRSRHAYTLGFTLQSLSSSRRT